MSFDFELFTFGDILLIKMIIIHMRGKLVRDRDQITMLYVYFHNDKQTKNVPGTHIFYHMGYFSRLVNVS